MRPRLIDICCKAGGAAAGYAQAGFDVFGVDWEPQPNYPFPFLQADLRSLTPAFVRAIADAIHISPPCQKHSALAARHPHIEHLDFIPEARALCEASGLPYVIENVMPAPLIKERSIVLCGEMFGLRTIRHRRFENNIGLVAPDHPPHSRPTATKQRKARWAEGWHVSITGDVGTYVGPEAMGIDWMTGDELCEAIPPAYTRLIGLQILAHLQAQRIAA